MEKETGSLEVTESNKQQWTLVLEPSRGWFDLHLKEVWQYRDLLLLFVRRDFVSVYKQTILGPLWFFIQPLLTTLVFFVIFGKIAKIPTDGIPQPLFYLAGIVGWNYFAECLRTTSDSFKKNEHIFGKVYFPRIIMPLSVVISNLLKFGIQLLLFLAVMGWYLYMDAAISPNAYVLLFPMLVLMIAGLGLGFGCIISSLTTKYRDLSFLIAFAIQLGLYATPVIYPLSEVPDYLRLFVLLNPMSSIIEAFRSMFLGTGAFNIGYLAYSFIAMLLILVSGIIIFNRRERTFMDTI
ncbi:MAG: ABC transporter permease [Bacteroidia bacterium]